MERRKSKKMSDSKIRDNGITIKLNNKFYDIKTIRDSIKDFKGLLRASVISNKEYYIISLQIIDKKIANRIKGEFCNYILGLMKNKQIV